MVRLERIHKTKNANEKTISCGIGWSGAVDTSYRGSEVVDDGRGCVGVRERVGERRCSWVCVGVRAFGRGASGLGDDRVERNVDTHS